MTLESAIKHAEEVAEENEYYVAMKGKVNASACLECASEHRQLAEWLRELRAYRMFKDTLYKSCDEWCKFPQYKENRTMCGACDWGSIQDLLENALEEVNADETE